MADFQFRNRLSGGRPTVRDFVFQDTETLSRGDMLNWENGKVDFGLIGDGALIGAALETLDGQAEETVIQAITDGDAVYRVEDRHSRSRGDHLDLQGLTGDQSVCESANSQGRGLHELEPPRPRLCRRGVRARPPGRRRLDRVGLAGVGSGHGRGPAQS